MSSSTQDSEDLLATTNEVRIVKAKRDHNGVAHEPAHHAMRAQSTVVWMAGTPPCIDQFVLDDCNAPSD